MDTENSQVESEYTYQPNLLDLMPETPADSIVSRTIFGGPGLKGTLFGFAAGQELSEHTAAHPAILHFLSGEARLTLGEETFIARPGAWIYMPAHLPHSVAAQTETVMLLLLLRN